MAIKAGPGFVIIDLRGPDMGYDDAVRLGWWPFDMALGCGILDRQFRRIWAAAPTDQRGYLVFAAGPPVKVVRMEQLTERQRRGNPRMKDPEWQREQARKRWGK